MSVWRGGAHPGEAGRLGESESAVPFVAINSSAARISASGKLP
jgi:hypothetical protein